ncbi:hypothetical protein [Intestinibacter sp.]
MFDNFEFIFKIAFFCLSIGWIGNILLLNSERQILINPLLILLASLIIVIPSDAKEVFGFEADNVRVFLYVFYYLVIIVGTTLTRGKKGKLKKR